MGLGTTRKKGPVMSLFLQVTFTKFGIWHKSNYCNEVVPFLSIYIQSSSSSPDINTSLEYPNPFTHL
ncbi:hypothetical protein EYC80_001999 [Monilinia laxa]|uniref:Uncharacterized protein n=1 Tax=Monilinia laxa TaxID=61186 RepID=A0A5N6K6U5_MONLA|nr:hypothetical protein EYC80_001999 [Monilinia laxa]